MAAVELDAEMLCIYPPHTTEQAQKYDELAALVADVEVLPSTFTYNMKSNKKLFLTRWLVARKWVVADAFKMFSDAVAWRNDNKIDETPLFPPIQRVRGYDLAALQEFDGRGARPTTQYIDEVAAPLRHVASSAWHKWDKQGRPIMIERTGKTNASELVRVTTALAPPGGDLSKPIVALHTHQNEVGGAILRHQAHLAVEKGETPPAQVCVIMDCTGLSMLAMQGPAMDLLKANSEMDKAYYPEGLHRFYVVNTTTTIRVFWGIVKLWIDERVQKKFVFLSPKDTKDGLLKDIDADCLPEFLGGTCCCADECVPDLAEPEADSGLASTEEFVVKSGGRATRTVELAEGDTALWEFIVVKNDINFSATFQPSAGGSQVEISAPEKLTKGDGTFVAPSSGVVTLTADNKHSWVKSKTMRMRNRKLAANAMTAETVEATDAEKEDATAAAASASE
jgi:hypothetical protein